jgi:hypothetical protein
MDGDLYPELLIAADFLTSRYLVNNGDGTFSDATAESGTGLDANGMGQTVGDFDGNGRLDWYVTSIYTPFSHLPSVPGTGNMLYMGQDEHLYLEQSVAAGVNDGGWGWGTVAIDADHDGLLDIVETNGWQQPNGPAGPEWADEQSYLFHNAGGGVFSDVATACGLIHTGQGRGLAALDYDNDGDLDLALFSFDGPLTLFRNDISGPDANWLRVVLDTASRSDLAPDGLGARVTVSAGGLTQLRLVEAGSNYLVQNEISAHFGLGAATEVTTIEVTWPEGSTTLRNDVVANQTVVIQPGDPADLDGDGSVATGDLLILLAAWGPCEDSCAADLDGNGTVGTGDLLILLGAWG